ncbi:hypothetical protein SO802_006806 [Lithocarpus litseifolius]|uniref:Uncharacterized protein n=1 Tax=Lithocarpus litseifolius TaxID=425828 RepID=A0AAW2DQ41_9ROSI
MAQLLKNQVDYVLNGLRSRAIPRPMEIYVDDETKLTLHSLVQHYILLEVEKNRKLNDLLDALDFNQCMYALTSPLGDSLSLLLMQGHIDHEAFEILQRQKESGLSQCMKCGSGIGIGAALSRSSHMQNIYETMADL